MALEAVVADAAVELRSPRRFPGWTSSPAEPITSSTCKQPSRCRRRPRVPVVRSTVTAPGQRPCSPPRRAGRLEAPARCRRSGRHPTPPASESTASGSDVVSTLPRNVSSPAMPRTDVLRHRLPSRTYDPRVARDDVQSPSEPVTFSMLPRWGSVPVSVASRDAAEQAHHCRCPVLLMSTVSEPSPPPVPVVVAAGEEEVVATATLLEVGPVAGPERVGPGGRRGGGRRERSQRRPHSRRSGVSPCPARARCRPRGPRRRDHPGALRCIHRSATMSLPSPPSMTSFARSHVLRTARGAVGSPVSTSMPAIPPQPVRAGAAGQAVGPVAPAHQVVPALGVDGVATAAGAR